MKPTHYNREIPEITVAVVHRVGQPDDGRVHFYLVTDSTGRSVAGERHVGEDIAYFADGSTRYEPFDRAMDAEQHTSRENFDARYAPVTVEQDR